MRHPAFDLDWNLVRTFVAVAGAGSLAAGARSLGITHPTAARHVQLLEESLGVSLFTRTTQGLVLNDTGSKLNEAAQRMHDSALQFQATTDGMRASPVSRVRISVAPILADLLPDLMMPHWQPHGLAGMSLDMVVTDDLVNLLQRDADIAVRHVRPQQQELLCRKLGELPMGLFAHECYLQRHGELRSDNFGDHWFVDGLTRDFMCRGAAQRGLVIEPEQISFRSDSVSCQRAAARAGWGIGAFPLWMAGDDTALVMVLPPDQVIDLEVWLVARPEVRENQQLHDVFRCLGNAVSKQLQHAA